MTDGAVWQAPHSRPAPLWVHTPRARAVGLLFVGGLAYVAWLALAPRVELGPHLEFGWIAMAATVPTLLVSALLTARLPGAAVTRLVTTMTLAHLVTLNFPVVASSLAQVDVPGAAVMSRIAEVAWAGTLPLIPLLLTVFPDGWPARGRWRGVANVQVGAVVAVAAATASGIAMPELPGIVQVVLIGCGAVLFGSAIARAVALTVAWWRSTGDRRRQLTWFTATAGLLVALYLVSGFMSLTGLATVGLLEPVIYAADICALPVALGVAVVRHRLYGLDIVVNRGLVWSMLSVVLLGLYGAAAAIAASVSGAPQNIAVSSLVAAIVAGLALGPVHRLAQTTVDRLMYGDRDRPDRVLRRLARQLSETLDAAEVPDRIVATVADALRVPFVALDRAVAHGHTRVAQRGSDSDTAMALAIPLTHAGADLGCLVVAPRHGEAGLASADRRLLEELAAQAGVALHAGRLADDLAESRERLVRGRLEERARLRRSLHEALSPSLSGIALATAAARARLTSDPDVVDHMLGRIEEEARASAAMVQALLEGLRPPGLEELGLLAAVDQRADHMAVLSGLDVVVERAPQLPMLSPDVEEAAYVIVVEALANVARHASATRCFVRVGIDENHLNIEVADDGTGLPPDHRPGVGLFAARERATSVGGSLEITTAGAGTRLRARLPVRSTS